MRISDIKDNDLRELAELRRSECNKCDSEYLMGAFFWVDTPEGDGFWGKVNDGTITELPNKIDKIQVVRNGHLEFRNVNNAPAEDNAIHELRADAKERDLSKLVDTLDDTINKLKALINE
jgi:hypothetical protein